MLDRNMQEDEAINIEIDDTEKASKSNRIAFGQKDNVEKRAKAAPKACKMPKRNS